MAAAVGSSATSATKCTATKEPCGCITRQFTCARCTSAKFLVATWCSAPCAAATGTLRTQTFTKTRPSQQYWTEERLAAPPPVGLPTPLFSSHHCSSSKETANQDHQIQAECLYASCPTFLKSSLDIFITMSKTECKYSLSSCLLRMLVVGMELAL